MKRKASAWLVTVGLLWATSAVAQSSSDVTGVPMSSVTRQGAGVGVNAGARAEMVDAIPVATRDVARGATLDSADMKGDADAVRRRVGLVAMRDIHSGDRLGWGVVGARQVVESGKDVLCIYSMDGVTVKVTGTALNSAVEDGSVGVRLSTRRRIVGKAQRDGSVLLR